MNTEKQYNGSFRGPGEDMLSPKRPPHTKRKAPNPMLLRVLRAAMLCVGGLILVLGLVVSVLPLFRIQNVESEGNSYYTTAQLMEAAEIGQGDEVFGVDLNAALKNIFDRCPYVEKCSVGISSPISVKITVQEKQGVMYAAVGGEYVTFEYVAKDASFRVLEKRADTEGMEPFLRVELPQVTSAEVGKKIRFASSDSDLSYTKVLTDALRENGIMERVASVDFSSISNLSYRLENGCTVKLGTMNDLDKKLKKAEALLAENADATVVDVQNPNSPTVQ
ncbi:MAG: FtsQ-type POTRA domain-containing protein [Clostridia bacterium]|nr:FtsQ-type POTRA domain-containing protein [Clostridia bacterium]